MVIGIEFDMTRSSFLVIWLTRGKVPMACADSNSGLRRFLVLAGLRENFGLHDKALRIGSIDHGNWKLTG
jgi:hypothetical protein